MVLFIILIKLNKLNSNAKCLFTEEKTNLPDAFTSLVVGLLNM